MAKGRKTQNFIRWMHGKPMVPRSDDDDDSDVASVKSTKSTKSKAKAKPKAAAKSRRNRKHEYRQNYPDPRPRMKERYSWDEDWHRGEEYRYKRRIPVLASRSIGSTPNVEARYIRPASLERMMHPRVPRDFWRDGVMIGPVPKSDSDNDSGYGSNGDDDDDDRIMFYDSRRDQISPPLRRGRIVVDPNPHFHVRWQKIKTPRSRVVHELRVINGFRDGVFRIWPQGSSKEAGRFYKKEYDEYRDYLEESTITSEEKKKE